MNGIVNLNTRVSELLNRMGVPDYTAGYSFLHTAIMSVYEQPDLLGSIIKCLYVVVANKHKTTVAHVEEELEHVLLAKMCIRDSWDRMGAFPYSPEEDTPAYSMDGAVDEDVKEARLAQLMKRQEEISLENQRRMVGEIIEVLVEDQEGLTGVYRGRGASSAPDEVDGIVMFKSERFIEFGSFVKVRITEALPHDFKGVEVC